MKWRGFTLKYALRLTSGFTLVELLVTIAIMVLLIGVSIPAFRTYNEKNRLQLAAEEVRDAIVEARSLALAPRKDDSGIIGYRFDVKPSSVNTLDIFTILTIPKDPNDPSIEIRTKTLPDNIVFALDYLPIDFKIEEKGQTANPRGILLIDDRISDPAQKTKNINVSQGGDVAVEE